MKPLLSWWVLILLIFITSCRQEDTKMSETVRPVKTMTLGNPETNTTRIFPGVTLATNETTLAFQVVGQIIQFPVLEGDHVTQGAVIAALDPLKYQEKVNETNAKLTRDKGNFERASKLVKEGHLSVADYDKVKSAYLISKADYNTAKNDLNNTKLISPFAGIVAKKLVKNYEYVNANQPVILLQDTDSIDIEINVPENTIVSLKKNNINQETLFASFDAIPNQKFNIHLKEYSSQADRETQTFRVVFTMKRSEKFNILPGMTVSVHVGLSNSQSENYFTIPASAVFQDNHHHAAVWIIDQTTMKVKKMTVTVSTLSKDQIQIVSGLKAGEVIVISGVHYLHEGQEVTILK